MNLSDLILERAYAAEKRLRKSPFWGRLYTGALSKDEYVSWLVQMHKYARNVVRGEVALAAAMAARGDDMGRVLATMSKKQAEEETGHDDMLLEDLAVLWNTTVDGAWGRVERTETAPGTILWEQINTNICARCPEGIIGVAYALETIAGLMTDEIRRNLLAKSGIQNIDKALVFLAAHSAEIEDGHASAGKLRIESLETPFERSAAFFGANAALTLFESVAHYLSELSEVREPVLTA
jgi:hypothetical protein